MDQYIDYIKNNIGNVNSNYEASEDNLATLGGNIGDIFIRAKGNEYNGLSIELLDIVVPLLTKHNILYIMDLIDKQEFMKALEFLKLDSIEQLEYVLWKWIINVFGVRLVDPTNKYRELDAMISRIRSDPINVPIKVVNIGQNKNTGWSVVPEDWIGKVFNSAYDMHREMDTFRHGPPTTFAVTYSMTKVIKSIITEEKPNNSTIYSTSHISGTDDTHWLYLGKDNKNNEEYIGFNMDLLVPLDSNNSGYDSGTILTKEEVSRIKELSSGVLASMLQKSIRRGAADLAEVVLRVLNSKPNYTLPDMGFMTVSSSRQCTWRLFISALEDVTYYSNGELSLLDLLLLSLIVQELKQYKFSDIVMDKIIVLAAQLCNTNYHTPFTNINGKYTGDLTLNLALDYMPMMTSDSKMLEQYLLLDTRYPLSDNLDNIGSNYDNNIMDVILSAFDHHCRPDIILVFQSVYSNITSTKDISKYIWNNSSVINYRLDQSPNSNKILLLREVQKLYWDGFPTTKNIINSIDTNIIVGNGVLSESDKRELFLILFGKSFKYNGTEYMISGNIEAPIKYKVKDKWLLSNDTSIFSKYPDQTINIGASIAPKGYRWIANKFEVFYDNNTSQFVARFGDKEVVLNLFDGSPLVQYNTPIINDTINDEDIWNMTSYNIEDILKYRSGYREVPLYLKPSSWNSELVILVYTKLFNRKTNKVHIGPVDRRGNKTENSINPLLEGKIWYIFNYLSWMYPEAIKISGTLNFTINTNSYQYNMLIYSLEEMLYTNIIGTNIIPSNPNIISTLWEHQQVSVNRMYNAYLDGIHGMGDASSVGSGKTLVGLALGTKLYGVSEGRMGILVLVPNKNLIDTWTDEINKHTTGYEVLLHTAKNKISSNIIKKNSIVISALNTMRDHPIRNSWILTIIDECLSVQNSNAMWTEEAWKQSLVSGFLILLSATFFRSRYNKLYYMLSMLQSIIPTDKEYLNTVLSERIVVHKAISNRMWHTNTNYIPFPDAIKNQYNSILQDNTGNQEVNTDAFKYGKLQHLLDTQRPYVAKYIGEILENIGDRKCVIFAESKAEASIFANILNLPIYSKNIDVTKTQHIIATTNSAAVGVNNLVHFDCLIMRPPPPDLLPQIKGRLDRPGQNNTNLYIEYFLISDSIDMGLELRMNIANNFNETYIMPLADFYRISVGIHN